MAQNMILKYVHGIPVRINNKIYINVHHKDYERILEQAYQLKISVSQLIRLSSGPCQKCGHDKVEICLTPMSSNIGKQGYTITKKWENNENNH
jgi:hypothetical protein